MPALRSQDRQLRGRAASSSGGGGGGSRITRAAARPSSSLASAAATGSTLRKRRRQDTTDEDEDDGDEDDDVESEEEKQHTSSRPRARHRASATTATRRGPPGIKGRGSAARGRRDTTDEDEGEDQDDENGSASPPRSFARRTSGRLSGAQAAASSSSSRATRSGRNGRASVNGKATVVSAPRRSTRGRQGDSDEDDDDVVRMQDIDSDDDEPGTSSRTLRRRRTTRASTSGDGDFSIVIPSPPAINRTAAARKARVSTRTELSDSDEEEESRRTTRSSIVQGKGKARQVSPPRKSRSRLAVQYDNDDDDDDVVNAEDDESEDDRRRPSSSKTGASRVLGRRVSGRARGKLALEEDDDDEDEAVQVVSSDEDAASAKRSSRITRGRKSNVTLADEDSEDEDDALVRRRRRRSSTTPVFSARRSGRPSLPRKRLGVDEGEDEDNAPSRRRSKAESPARSGRRSSGRASLALRKSYLVDDDDSPAEEEDDESGEESEEAATTSRSRRQPTSARRRGPASSDDDEDEMDQDSDERPTRSRAAASSSKRTLRGRQVPRAETVPSDSDEEIVASTSRAKAQRGARKPTGPTPRSMPSRNRQRRDRLNILDSVPDEDHDSSEGSTSDSSAGRGRKEGPTQQRARRMLDRMEMSDRSDDDDSSSSSGSSSDVTSDETSDISPSEEEEVEPAEPVEIDDDELQPFHSIQFSAAEDGDSDGFIDMVGKFGDVDSEPESEQRFTSRGRRVHKRRRLGVETEEERTRQARRREASALSDDEVESQHDSDTDLLPSQYARLEEADDADATQRHFDTCYRCDGKPGWHLFRGLKMSRVRLAKERVKQEKKGRKKRRKMRREGLRDGARARRFNAQYEEGLHALELAESALDDRFAEVKTKAAWLRCSTCSASMHTGCRVDPHPEKLLREINRDAAAVHRIFQLEGPPPQPRTEFQPSDVVEGVQCSLCADADWICMICSSKCIEKPAKIPSTQTMVTAFRCKRCARAAHYGCIQAVAGEDSMEEAALARQQAGWKCLDCESWGDVDVILAWRHVGEEVAERERDYRHAKIGDDLKREYLIKFKNTSFKETQWVPHFWLRSVASASLRHFLAHGSRLELDASTSATAAKDATAGEPSSTPAAATAADPPRRRSKRLQLALTVSRETGEVMRGPPPPEPDAQQRIPKTWITPDRILDVYLSVSAVSDADLVDPVKVAMFHRRPRKITKIGQGAGISARKDQLEQSTKHIHISHVNQDVLEGLSEGKMFDLLQDAIVLIKWEDLEYEQSTWEDGVSPVSYGERWRAFVGAFRRYLHSRKVYVSDKVPERPGRSRFESIDSQPTYIKGGRMLDFQIEGLNWLRYGWHARQPGILADEMGLGKTVQIIAFIASLHHEMGGLAPYLVVVPNSVVTNWVREFEHWCPHLRVVPYFGGRESRGVIERFEMFHLESIKGRQDLRAEVIVCSDTVARLDPAPFRRVRQWQVLVVDEGTNLKAGASTLIYKRLSALNAAHRLIMTGTPLNNNIGELFNLLNWLKPNAEWKDLKSLREKYAVLTPELIAELQPLLRPYILRRLKKDVVNLPARSEVLVPVSLTPLQKRVYKDVLERNVEDINALTHLRKKRAQKYHIGNLLNVLMQLRKACQHPYLIAPTLENFDVRSDADWKLEAQRLIEASAKLVLLQKLLPILKERGHRVLIFSQFVIYLDIVESFLLNEGDYKYQRLDGHVGNRQRQQGIQAFNAPGSDLFCYLLSTRAGGVGINLASADTVIILDQDFNPHLDMQAIARAHRIGQKKKVLVFTLVTRDTAEEKIVAMARKKLALDQVIHNMDDEENNSESLQEVLRFGARALFQSGGTEESRKDLRYSHADVEKLVKDCEEGEDVTQDSTMSLLAFAKVWERDEGEEEENDPTADMAEEGFWAALLERTRAQQEQRQEAEEQVIGRGGQRRAKLQAMGLASANFPGLREGDDESDEDNENDAAEVEQIAAPSFDPSFDNDGPDFTMDVGDAPSSSESSDEGTPELDGVAVTTPPAPPSASAPAAPAASTSSQPQPEKRKRGRPPKPRPPPTEPPTLLDLAFSNTSRRLKVPKPPAPAKQPRARKSAAQPRVAPTPPMNSANGETNIYNRIAEVTDPTVAREMAFANFPGRPELAMALFRAWSDIILKRTGSAPRMPSNVDAAARAAAQAAASSSSMLPPVTRLADPVPGAQPAPAPKRRGRPPKNKQPPAEAPSNGEQPASAQPTPAMPPPRPRPRPSVAPKARMPAPTAAPASAPPAEETPPTHIQSRRSVAELKKMLRDLPEDFVAQVRTRHAEHGAPTALLAQSGRSQLTTQHMAYFSLRILRSITGVHPLFHDAFTLVQSEQVPPTLRAQPFEGAEMLSTPIITERLVETAHYFFAQLWAAEGGAPATKGGTATATPSEKPAPKPKKPRKPRVSKAAQAQSQTQAQVQAPSQPPSLPQPSSHHFAPANRGPISAPSPMTVDSVLNHHSEFAPSYRTDASSSRRPVAEPGHASNSFLYHGTPTNTPSWSDNAGPSTPGSSRRRGNAMPSGPPTAAPASWNGHAHGPRSNAPTPAATATAINNAFSYAQQHQQQQGSNAPVEMIPASAQPPASASSNEQLAFFWLQSIDSLNLAGLSKAARMWLIQPSGPDRDAMGQEINGRLATELERRRRLGLNVPDFFR